MEVDKIKPLNLTDCPSSPFMSDPSGRHLAGRGTTAELHAGLLPPSAGLQGPPAPPAGGPVGQTAPRPPGRLSLHIQWHWAWRQCDRSEYIPVEFDILPSDILFKVLRSLGDICQTYHSHSVCQAWYSSRATRPSRAACWAGDTPGRWCQPPRTPLSDISSSTPRQRQRRKGELKSVRGPNWPLLLIADGLQRWSIQLTDGWDSPRKTSLPSSSSYELFSEIEFSFFSTTSSNCIT